MATNILVECPDMIVSVSLGVLACLRPLEEAGGCTVRYVKTSKIKNRDIAWADILISVRTSDLLSVEIMRAAKNAGRLVIMYLDDDLLHIPDESLVRDYYQDPGIQRMMREAFETIDILWGVNPNIRDIYLPMTRGARWIRNRVPKEPGAEIPNISDTDPIKVLYAGSKDHHVMVREILSPVVKRICREYGDRVDFTFIGANPFLSDVPNVHYIPFIKPYESYVEYVNNGRFSIGLAPVRTDSFFACKYYNKFLEYTAIGAVGVYTRHEPYTQIVEDGVNGVLCDNTGEGWYQAIKSLLDNRELLRSCAEQARALLVEKFNRKAATEDFFRQCPELCEYKAPEVPARKIKIKASVLGYYWGRLKYHWQKKGILGIPFYCYRFLQVLVMAIVGGIKSFVQNVFIRN